MLALKIATTADALEIATIYVPVVKRTWISFEVDAPSVDEIARRIVATQAHFPWLVAVDDGIQGYAYATEHRTREAYRWSVDVSVYVAERSRRTGVARDLYRALFAILNEQGFYNAFAGITLPNEPSLGLHRALGFTPVGIYRNVGYKLGAWRDVSWWQRELAPPAAVVAEPITFPTIRDRVATALLRSAAFPA